MSDINMNRVFRCCNKANPSYNKLKTGGNDPTISKAKRASQYLNNVKPSIHFENMQGYLDNRGLIYVPVTFNYPNFKQKIIDNNIIFPREKIYI